MWRDTLIEYVALGIFAASGIGLIWAVMTRGR